MNKRMTFGWFFFFAAVIAVIGVLAWQFQDVRHTIFVVALVVWGGLAVVLGVREVYLSHKDYAAWGQAIREPGYPDPREHLHRIADELFPPGMVRDMVNGSLEGMDREQLARMRQSIALDILRRTDAQKTVLPKRSNNHAWFMDVDRHALGVLAPPDKGDA